VLNGIITCKGVRITLVLYIMTDVMI